MIATDVDEHGGARGLRQLVQRGGHVAHGDGAIAGTLQRPNEEAQGRGIVLDDQD